MEGFAVLPPADKGHRCLGRGKPRAKGTSLGLWGDLRTSGHREDHAPTWASQMGLRGELSSVCNSQSVGWHRCTQQAFDSSRL